MDFAWGAWILVAALLLGTLLLVAMLAGRRAERRRAAGAAAGVAPVRDGSEATDRSEARESFEPGDGAEANDPARLRGPTPAPGGGAPAEPPPAASMSQELSDPYDGWGETSYRDVPLSPETERDLRAFEATQDTMFTEQDHDLLRGDDPRPPTAAPDSPTGPAAAGEPDEPAGPPRG